MSRPPSHDPKWKKNIEVHPLLSARFAFHLKRHRADRNWKLEECAAKLGISDTYVFLLEGGARSPSLDLVERSAKVFGVDPAAMLEDPK